jgi:SnoaL-like domain
MNSNGKTPVSDADHVQLERLVTEAAWRVDEGRSDTLYELFVEDGMLLLGNSELKGHDAIRNWGRQLEDAHTYKCIRHVAGSMRFHLLNERDAEGVTFLTVFRVIFTNILDLCARVVAIPGARASMNRESVSPRRFGHSTRGTARAAVLPPVASRRTSARGPSRNDGQQPGVMRPR